VYTIYVLLVLCQVGTATGFYVPGIAPVDYAQGDELAIKTTKLVSRKSVLPYNYYSLPFCRPKKMRKYPENLGELLSGARVYSTPFQVQMLTDVKCAVLCKRRLRNREAHVLAQRIRQEYRVLLQLDNLPVGEPVYADGQKIGIERGYPLGVADAAGTYLNNHLSFTIYYHRPTGRFRAPSKGYRIVGYEVTALSVDHQEAPDSNDQSPSTIRLTTCSPKDGLGANVQRQIVQPNADVIYTYDVQFVESTIAWGSRWDIYLQQPRTAASIHWFSIINSSLIVLFLAATVFMILLRTLRQDILRYNSVPDGEEEDEDEYGWKLIHGDVFRAPTNLSLFAVLVGSGVQLLGMIMVVLVIAVAGFLSPANRGGLVTAMVMLWLIMTLPGGYTAARIHKMYRGLAPKRVTLTTAVLFPGLCFTTFFALNLVLWMLQSSAAVPFLTLLYMFVLWFGISIPMAFLGSYLGYRRPVAEFPCRTNVIPRQIPPIPLYARTWVGMLIGGLLPFGSLFLSLFFILNSVLFQRYYYFFGFLMASFIILLVTTALNSTIFVYIRLSVEDWRWPWYAFSVSASTGGYVFLYSMLYLWKKYEIDGETALSCILFIVYAAIASSLIGAALGAVGFLASSWFVRRIYTSVKLD
jgi:transmembrane 9 superfamily protein 2/4